MKKKLNLSLLVALAAGVLGALLNGALVLWGYEANGLPKRLFVPGLVLPLVAIGAMAAVVVLHWRTQSDRKYLKTFTASLPVALALVVLGLGLGLDSILSLGSGAARMGGLSLWRCILGIACCPVLLLCAWQRGQGKRPVWLCWAVVTAYAVLVLVASYPAWSREASFNRYAYELLACVSLMLAAYHQSAADAGIGNLKEYLIFSLFAVCLCPIAMVGSSQWLFYLCFFVYHSLNLYCLNLTDPKEGA